MHLFVRSEELRPALDCFLAPEDERHAQGAADILLIIVEVVLFAIVSAKPVGGIEVLVAQVGISGGMYLVGALAGQEAELSTGRASVLRRSSGIHNSELLQSIECNQTVCGSKRRDTRVLARCRHLQVRIEQARAEVCGDAVNPIRICVGRLSIHAEAAGTGHLWTY